jgi:hypothetical protein
LRELCQSDITVQINSDIAGLGIYISYIMQLCIMLIAWLYAVSLALWKRCPQRGTSWKRRPGWIEYCSTRVDVGPQYDALITVLVEYHKAQCYFTITLQAASLLALGGHGHLLDAPTYKQIGPAVALLGDIAAAASVCLTFGLYLLHNENKKDWYVSIFTFMASTLSAMVWILTRTPLDNLQATGRFATNLPRCGGFVRPTKFCYVFTPTHWATLFEAPIVAWCFTFFLVLLGRESGRSLVKSISHYTPILHSLPSTQWIRTVGRFTFPAKIRNRLNQRHGNIRTTIYALTEFTLALSAIIMLVWLTSPAMLDYKAQTIVYTTQHAHGISGN